MGRHGLPRQYPTELDRTLSHHTTCSGRRNGVHVRRNRIDRGLTISLCGFDRDRQWIDQGTESKSLEKGERAGRDAAGSKRIACPCAVSALQNHETIHELRTKTVAKVQITGAQSRLYILRHDEQDELRSVLAETTASFGT